MNNIILEFEGIIYITKLEKLLSIKELYINTIDSENSNCLQNNINEYFFLKNNKLVCPETNLDNSDDSDASDASDASDVISTVKCYKKQRGGIGIMDIIEPVLDMILKIFDPIIDPINAIIAIFKILIKLILWLVNFIVWLVFFIGWLFTDLLNPVHFFNDFWNSLVMIIFSFFSGIFNILMGLVQLSVNTLGGWMQGFWGWDQSSLTANDMNSNYFKSINRTSGKKCYLTNSNTVPFSVILGTILCPPIGVFMDLGLTGWLNILICILLTLLFYIPGLVYALLIIYS